MPVMHCYLVRTKPVAINDVAIVSTNSEVKVVLPLYDGVTLVEKLGKVNVASKASSMAKPIGTNSNSMVREKVREVC